MPIAERNHSAGAGARSFKGAFVLLRSVDVIRKLIVEINVVELAGRLIVHGAPGVAAIGRDCSTAIVALKQNPGIVRIDPHDVIVAVRRAEAS